ncbi:hypothetical protein BGZ70_007892 [Mortierella alpina]|uniref:Uncharacterized protein n=1 Tax=Mortierella alpina TaxID=64518 RepID=A0A9P6J4T2_MORAP|nr:hypothetical protein BGZ70_007892 [Mortierella alpina]
MMTVNLEIMGHAFLKHHQGTLCGVGLGLLKGHDGDVPGSPTMSSLPDTEEHIAAFGNQVRVHKDLSAIQLCDSPTSWGSSFLSLDEGIFCDMSTKTKIPICKAGETDGCFIYERPRVNGRGGYSTKRIFMSRDLPDSTTLPTL